MKIETSKFGTIEVREDQEIKFTHPIIGFPELVRYVLIDTGGGIKWLQALDDPAVVFPMVDPFVVKPDYDVEIPTSDAEILGAKSVDELQLWCITVLSTEKTEVRANLRAPIVMNRKSGTAKQVVLPDNKLPIRFHFVPRLTESNKEVANAGVDT